MARAKKIVGTFCDEVRTPKSQCASESYRWQQTPKKRAWMLFCCKKSAWNSKTKTCRPGNVKLHLFRKKVSKGERCPSGTYRSKF